MNCYNICYVYRVLICQIYVKMNIRLQMKFGEIFWGEVKIDALKGGVRYKQKGNDKTIFSPSNS